MENKLTNEEIARVFAMYLGCQAKGNGTMVYTLCNVDIAHRPLFKDKHGNECDLIGNAKLLLTPLSLISDEDAVEVAKIISPDKNPDECTDQHWKESFIEQVLNRDALIHHSIGWFTFQYLISKGYAVPLFFGINHWANGKTAIELGIAIDKTKI